MSTTTAALLARVEALAAHATAPRRAAFARLQAVDPAQAEWLRQMAAAFGRPAAIALRFADGERFERGTFTAAQAYPDFGDRCRAFGPPACRRQVEGTAGPPAAGRREFGTGMARKGLCKAQG